MKNTFQCNFQWKYMHFFTTMHLKMLHTKWPPFCLSGYILLIQADQLSGRACICHWLLPRVNTHRDFACRVRELSTGRLTHWPLVNVAVTSNQYLSNIFYRLRTWKFPVKLPSYGCTRTYLMISLNWFRWGLGAISHQAITWTNDDSDPWCHMASLGQLELNCHF